jgi:DNA repair protein RecO (recombination protein O)
MSENAIYGQSAFVLQYKKYRETSLILDLFTEDYGRVSLLAKGVRKAKSKTAGVLQPFISLAVSFVGKADLKTLTHVEIKPPLLTLKGMPLYCGFYLNELVQNFLFKYDPHPQVFSDFRQCLIQLSNNKSIEMALRVFEVRLLENIGYGLQLNHDAATGKPIAAEKCYAFYPDLGVREQHDGWLMGKTVIALRSGRLDSQQELAEAKKLMRSAIDFHLPDKPLNSRAMMARMLKSSTILKS